MDTSPGPEKKEGSPWKADPDILNYGPSPLRPSPEQRRWAGLPIAILFLAVVLAFVVWVIFFK